MGGWVQGHGSQVFALGVRFRLDGRLDGSLDVVQHHILVAILPVVLGLNSEFQIKYGASHFRLSSSTASGCFGNGS